MGAGPAARHGEDGAAEVAEARDASGQGAVRAGGDGGEGVGRGRARGRRSRWRAAGRPRVRQHARTWPDGPVYGVGGPGPVPSGGAGHRQGRRARRGWRAAVRSPGALFRGVRTAKGPEPKSSATVLRLPPAGREQRQPGAAAAHGSATVELHDPAGGGEVTAHQVRQTPSRPQGAKERGRAGAGAARTARGTAATRRTGRRRCRARRRARAGRDGRRPATGGSPCGRAQRPATGRSGGRRAGDRARGAQRAGSGDEGRAGPREPAFTRNGRFR